jgi:hypothetical protein
MQLPIFTNCIPFLGNSKLTNILLLMDNRTFQFSYDYRVWFHYRRLKLGHLNRCLVSSINFQILKVSRCLKKELSNIYRFGNNLHNQLIYEVRFIYSSKTEWNTNQHSFLKDRLVGTLQVLGIAICFQFVCRAQKAS